MYRQAVKKGVASKRNNKTKDPEGHAIIKQFIALALLPVDAIKPKFLELKKKLLELNDTKWLPFLKYFETTWIKGYKPDAFCVYGEIVRTNNIIEVYHRVLNSYLTSSLTASGFISKFKMYFRSLF